MDNTKYKDHVLIGKGGYGKVYKALDKRSQKLVAIKVIPLKDEYGLSDTTLKEVVLLKALSEHKHIVNLLDIFYEKKQGGSGFLNLVFEYMSWDLSRYKNYANPQFLRFSVITTKRYIYQLLSTMAYCHEQGVMHRDIKPENILIKDHYTLKIADFGLSKAYWFPLDKYTKNVVTLWYRAPEILLGALYYTTAIDIWSIGCIFIELLYGRPLFYGNNDIEQLFSIFRVCGTPDVYKWPKASIYTHWKKFPQWKSIPMNLILYKLDSVTKDLITKMIDLNPHSRITAKEALLHPYFLFSF